MFICYQSIIAFTFYLFGYLVFCEKSFATAFDFIVSSYLFDNFLFAKIVRTNKSPAFSGYWKLHSLRITL